MQKRMQHYGRQNVRRQPQNVKSITRGVRDGALDDPMF